MLYRAGFVVDYPVVEDDQAHLTQQVCLIIKRKKLCDTSQSF